MNLGWVHAQKMSIVALLLLNIELNGFKRIINLHIK